MCLCRSGAKPDSSIRISQLAFSRGSKKKKPKGKKNPISTKYENVTDASHSHRRTGGTFNEDQVGWKQERGKGGVRNGNLHSGIWFHFIFLFSSCSERKQKSLSVLRASGYDDLDWDPMPVKEVFALF